MTQQDAIRNLLARAHGQWKAQRFETMERDDMIRSARSAVYDNARHSEESLGMLLASWFPGASEELIDDVVAEVL